MQTPIAPSVRTKLLPLLLALTLAVGLMTLSSARAAEPGEGTVSAGSPEVTWEGQSYVGASNPSPTAGDPVCTPAASDPANQVCDHFFVTVDGTGALRVEITWEDALNDFDLYVYDEEGGLAGSSAQGGTTEEAATVPGASGVYEVQVVPFSVIESGYAGVARLEGGGDEPPPDGEEPPSSSPATTCLTGDEPFTYEQEYIDETRAGGEPITTTHPDGTLLWGSHAGTTHFFSPGAPDPNTAAFLQNYEGQTYQYFSEDNGVTWEFAPRIIPPSTEIAGLPASGFSDPEFAIDAAGNVFISEINLANVAVSKSIDSGRTYTLQNLASFTSSDRQWMAADEEDVLYMTANGFGGGTFPNDPAGNLGHFFAKSTDGGVNWSEALRSNPDGVADIKIDPRDGTLYELSLTDGRSGNGTVGMAAFRNIRNETEDFSDPEITVFAEGAGFSPINRLIDPTFDMDSEGNLYLVYSENGTGVAGRPAGMYYTYSTDGARTWAEPVRVDPDARTEIWPWLTVGAPGQVAINYYGTEAELPNNDAEQAAPEDEWDVISVTTQTGLGCEDSEVPGFRFQQATSEHVHNGTICQGGTACQAQLIDRRLGDYFANEIDGDGNLFIASGDTRQGGAVALPLIVRQTSGPNFLEQPEPPEDPGPQPTEVPTEVPTEKPTDGPTDQPTEQPTGEPTPPPTGEDETVRLFGPERVETALEVSRDSFEDGAAGAVVLSRSDLFPDALAGTPLAVDTDAPLLLTPSDQLDDRVATELRRVLPQGQTVYLLGGVEALSEDVAQAVTDAGYQVVRYGGANRFATAAVIAEDGLDAPETLLLATGDTFADALPAGAAAGVAGGAVLLTDGSGMPAETRAYLDAHPDGERFAVGGPAAQALPEATALIGANRVATAVVVADQFVDAPTVAGLATAGDFADALTGGAQVARLGGPLLLTANDALSDEVAGYLRDNADSITTAYLYGGTQALSSEVETAVDQAIR